MGLSSAHLQAIRAAQMGADWRAGETGKKFSEKFQANYKEIVERREKEFQAVQTAGIETLEQMDKLKDEQSSLGFFKLPVQEWLANTIEPAMYALDTKYGSNKFEREKAQSGLINNEVKTVLGPISELIQYATMYGSTNIEAKDNKNKGFSEVHRTETVTIGGKTLNKYDVVQAIGAGWKQGKLGLEDKNPSIFVTMKGEVDPETGKQKKEQVEIFLSDIKSDELKVDLKNEAILKEEYDILDGFKGEASKVRGKDGNMSEKSVRNMVERYITRKSDDEKQYLAYNMWQFNDKERHLKETEKPGVYMEDGEEKSIDDVIRDHGINWMTNAISDTYPYIPPEVEEEDVPEGDTPYFITQKTMLDKIISKFNRYRVGEKPNPDYYESQEFQGMLPPQLTYVKKKGKVQIQSKDRPSAVHTIDPKMSLEYNINQLKALLKSKKP